MDRGSIVQPILTKQVRPLWIRPRHLTGQIDGFHCDIVQQFDASDLNTLIEELDDRADCCIDSRERRCCDLNGQFRRQSYSALGHNTQSSASRAGCQYETCIEGTVILTPPLL